MGISLGALIPNRTRFLPTSRMVISMLSARTIFWSLFRLMISINTFPLEKVLSYIRRIFGVIKIATSFAALSKLGPAYHFETSFYADGPVDKKTRTLKGNLILQSTGDPVLTSIDVSRLVRDVVRAGISRVNGDLVVTGPFTY